MNLVDPDGRKVEDPDELVIKFKQMIKENIRILNEISESINSLHINKSEINNVLNEYKTILDELDVLEKSDDVFKVEYCEQKDGGEIYWDNGVVIIKINNKTDYGLIGHELKHAYQFTQGEISFDVVTGEGGLLYDITDENNAFLRQAYVNSGVYYQNENEQYSKILKEEYNHLNTKSYNIHTKDILKILHEKKEIFRIPK